MTLRLPFRILRQPDDATCGPTCLHAVYRFFEDDVPLDEVIAQVPMLEEGGTLAVFLGCHAVRRGYRATITTYNLRLFDPTWFASPDVDLVDRLTQQARVKRSSKLRAATDGYLEFLRLGGVLGFEDLTSNLIRRHLDRNRPILTGLSATFLYRTAREIGDGDYDDLRGKPVGHFIVICGYHGQRDEVLVADPLHPNPVSDTGLYSVDLDRLTNAILLGVLTHDANLLVLDPPGGEQRVE